MPARRMVMPVGKEHRDNEVRLIRDAKDEGFTVQIWGNKIYVLCKTCRKGWYGIHGAVTCCRGLDKTK